MNPQTITLGNTHFLVISLNQPLTENQELFPGDPNITKELFTDINQTGYHHYVWKISDHHFHPHADAPNHQNLELQHQDLTHFDLSYQFNPACLIDLSQVSEAETINQIQFLTKIEKHHLQPHTNLFSQKGAVIIRTGYDRWLEANHPHNLKRIPYFTKKAGEFLTQFSNLKVIGVDSLTVDELRSHTVHQLFKEKLIVESLVNLHQIPKENHQNFNLQTSPIAIKGATGGPVTTFAFIKKD